MEYTVRKFDLLSELTLIQGVVERKTTIPILANVLLRAQTEGLEILGTDLDVGIRSLCPINLTTAGTSTVPAKRLYEIVRALPDRDIKFKKGDGNWVTVTCGTSRFRIAGLPQEDFPAIPAPPDTFVRIPAPVLAKLIGRTAFAISTEDSKYTLSGSLLVLKPGSLTMVATDGHRLAHIEKSHPMEDVSEEMRILVPRKAMIELTKVLADEGAGEELRFSADENHLFFQAGKRSLVSRKLAGQFPNYEAVLPRNNDRTFTIQREEIMAAVRRVALLSDERSRTVKLSLGKGLLEVAASHTDLGEAHETMEVAYTKEEMQVGFNYQYLLDFLGAVDEAQISFEFKDSESAAQLRTIESGEYNYRYVVMPMRI